MQVPSDAMTDPTEGGRLHHDQQARKSHRRVSLCCGAGMQPTLTLTSHVGEEIAGAPLKLDHIPADLVVTPRSSHKTLAISIRYPHDVSSAPTAISREMRHGPD